MLTLPDGQNLNDTVIRGTLLELAELRLDTDELFEVSDDIETSSFLSLLDTDLARERVRAFASR